ncbi:hypothetical protein ACQP2E_17900 [Actinoplanes sp. CA-015351]|uniref:hypothetical protein n=1 Tax=Actinoplanes sp. CA-015351 TaxID=3239897 RepID=UPI003D97B84B
MTDRPGFTPETVLRGMSLRRRISLVLVGLAGGCGAVLLLLLWLTEPGPLPLRTRLAFGALVIVGASWSAYAIATLARLPMFAADRVIAGWLALTFTTLTTAVSAAVAIARPGPLPLAATLSALITVGVAALILRRARAQRKRLQARADLLAEPSQWPDHRHYHAGGPANRPRQDEVRPTSDRSGTSPPTGPA